MAIWRFRCYGESVPNAWAQWFEQRNRRDQAKHDSVFDILEQQQVWRGPHYKILKGPPPAIAEIILRTDVAWRIFGYKSDEFEFTVTGFGNHKDDIYKPKNVIELSRSRRVDIESDKLKVMSCVRPKKT